MVPGPNYPRPLTVDSGGRWYPSLTTLADGRVLITSGVTVGGAFHSRVCACARVHARAYECVLVGPGCGGKGGVQGV